MSDLGRALARIPSGLFIVTSGRLGAGGEDEATGMLASFVQQVGFEPPMVAVAVRTGRTMEARIRHTGSFCVAILHRGSRPLMGHFAAGFEAGEPAFEGLDLEVTRAGVPFPAAAAGHLECVVRGEFATGDHVVLFGEVVAGDLRSEDPPLVHVRTNGMSY